MIKWLFTFLLAPLSILSCKAKPTGTVLFNNSKLVYEGRIGYTDTSAILSWPGTSVMGVFAGAQVAARLRDSKGDNYYYVILDGKMVSKIRPDTTWQDYTLAANLLPGRHTVQLFKLTESRFGNTEFKGFMLSGRSAGPFSAAKQQRRIEFYGNSITVGYSVDDATGDSGQPEYENNYYSYAAITARHYKAHYTCIAKSGIGLMVSWYPIIMPEMYDRLFEADTLPKWVFNTTVPNILVINLLQNDSWLVKKKDHPQFRARFGSTEPNADSIVAAYVRFISLVRMKYPAATIICALGSMDATKDGSPWPGYLNKAVAQLNDAKVLGYIFPYQGKAGHPKRTQQQQMAQQLIQFIDANVRW